jgi:hypothetical protein
MRVTTIIVLILFAQIFGAGLCNAQSSDFIGVWKAEVIFGNGERRSLRFEVRDSGKGSYLPLVPRPNQGGSSEPSLAEWTRNEDQSLRISGPVQFPLGNVGLERGTLLLKGKLGADGSITGEATFFTVDQQPAGPTGKPSKRGTFRASRVAK